MRITVRLPYKIAGSTISTVGGSVVVLMMVGEPLGGGVVCAAVGATVGGLLVMTLVGEPVGVLVVIIVGVEVGDWVVLAGKHRVLSLQGGGGAPHTIGIPGKQIPPSHLSRPLQYKLSSQKLGNTLASGVHC